MSDRPTMPSPDGRAPAPLTLHELRSLFGEWFIISTPSGALTATRKTGAATRVVGANSPAELAVILAGIESEESS